MKFTFAKRNDQPKTMTNAQIKTLIKSGAEIVRAGDEWMKVVNERKGKKVTLLRRPVEYFSAGAEQEFQSAAQDRSLAGADSFSKFIYVAMTHTEDKPPVSWRLTNKFIDRAVAIADFDIYLCKAGYHYHSALIAFEAWTIWFDDVDIVDFPIWRGVLEVDRKTKLPKSRRTVDRFIKLWERGLESLEEIEEASRSLLSAPSPEILDHLDAPVRLVRV